MVDEKELYNKIIGNKIPLVNKEKPSQKSHYQYRIIKTEKITGLRFWKHFIFHKTYMYALLADDYYMLIEHQGKRFWMTIASQGIGWGDFQTIDEQIRNEIYWHFYDKAVRSNSIQDFLALNNTEETGRE
jgi:hypothetical protein